MPNLPRPKRSIFDETLPGEAPETLDAVPPPGTPRKPKASIFDQTLAGDVTVPEPVGPSTSGPWWAFWRRPEVPSAEATVPPEPSRLPVKPRRTVTLPSIPDPDPAMARLLDEAIAEATGIEAPQEVVAPLHPEVRPAPVDLEGEPWEEGTAAEWNPRWAAAQRTPLAEPVPPPSFRRPWGLLLATAALLILGGSAFVLLGRPGGGEVARAVPPSPELRAYLDKAQAGDVGAMRMVGIRYAYGLEAPADRAEGVRWLRRAANAGSEGARRELAALEGVR